MHNLDISSAVQSKSSQIKKSHPRKESRFNIQIKGENDHAEDNLIAISKRKTQVMKNKFESNDMLTTNKSKRVANQNTVKFSKSQELTPEEQNHKEDENMLKIKYPLDVPPIIKSLSGASQFSHVSKNSSIGEARKEKIVKLVESCINQQHFTENIIKIKTDLK